jgi:hypothetical protein
MTEGMAFEGALDGTEPGVQRFRKKPVTVQCLLWTGTNIEALREFAQDEGGSVLDLSAGKLEIWNSEERDWIACPVGHTLVRGLLGEFYPVSPDALAKGFEPVTDAEVRRD